ncbi:hypothetical protein EBZ39_00575 [bacterium]|nr:hypothetical protein [bacterium]
MLHPEQMSQAEKQFIRTYVAAMRRDFSLVTSVMGLMNPDYGAIEDAALATKMAVELQHMHAEFERSLHELPSLRGFFRKPVFSGPTLDDLADLFALSFFKVFTVAESPNFGKKKKDAGWFSGKPDEWHELFKQLDDTSSITAKKDSSMFNMFSKFLPQLKLFQNFPLAQSSDDANLKSWPQKYDQGWKKNQHPDYDDVDDEYDEEEDE